MILLQNMKLAFLAFVSLVALSSFAISAPADTDEIDFSPSYFTARYDFVLVMQVKRLKNWTDYKGCSLDPLGQVHVGYTIHSRSDKNLNLPLTAYEDLWYHEIEPIGCKRFRSFPDVVTGLSAIEVLPSEDAGAFAGGIANACIRLMLDMSIHNAMCPDVIVPNEIYGSVVSSFSRFGFYEVTNAPETAIPGRISITIMSHKIGEQTRLYFHDPVM